MRKHVTAALHLAVRLLMNNRKEMKMGISLDLGNFVANTSFEDIPKENIAEQKKSVIDCIGNILGGSGIGDGCQEFVNTAVELSGEDPAREATVIGFNGLKLPAVWAAFANGSMAHSLDFGDSALNGGHPNNSAFPAALAVSEALGNIDGKEFLTAAIVGSEVCARLTKANRRDAKDLGFYPPVIYSSFGATASVAKLLALDPVQVINAFSFNLCQTTCSAEILNNSNTVMRSVRECFGAKSAVISGFLAKKDLKGFDFPLEGEYGFFHAYARDEYEPKDITDGLGTVFMSGNLAFKPWPSCLGTHTAINAALLLRKEHSIDPLDIKHVHIKVSLQNQMLVEPDEIKKAPRSASIAKFSTLYTVAVALIKGNVTINDFSDEALKDKDVLELTSKMTHEVVSEWGRLLKMNTEVTIETGNGTFTKFLNVPYGYPDNPISYESLCEKMYANAKAAKNPPSDQCLNEIRYTVEHLDELSDIRELTRLL